MARTERRLLLRLVDADKRPVAKGLDWAGACCSASDRTTDLTGGVRLGPGNRERYVQHGGNGNSVVL